MPLASSKNNVLITSVFAATLAVLKHKKENGHVILCDNSIDISKSRPRGRYV